MMSNLLKSTICITTTALLTAAGTFAAEDVQPNKAPKVRQLDTPKVLGESRKLITKVAKSPWEYRQEITKDRKRNKPQAIRDAKTLKEVFKYDGPVKRIQSEVDFDKQQLILIAWYGSANDTAPRPKASAKSNHVTFYEVPLKEGPSKLGNHHIYLYAIHKDAKWNYKEEPQIAGPCFPPLKGKLPSPDPEPLPETTTKE